MTKTRWIGNSELFKSTFEVTVRYKSFVGSFNLTTIIIGDPRRSASEPGFSTLQREDF